MSPTRTWTEAELMSLPRDGCKRELVDGEIVTMSPAGRRHGIVLVRLSALLWAHVERLGLGEVVDSSTGVWMPGGNLRSPDLAFTARARLVPDVGDGFVTVVPDLIVEVLSPGDSKRESDAKIAEYLAAGVNLAWVIDPRSRSAQVHRPGFPVQDVDETGELEGGEIVPGFRCRLASILP
jgi:Uma2 family endonuclease